VRQTDLAGRFVWDFRASVLNASKVAKQQGLERMMGILINPIMIQLGIVGPEEIFRMVRDSALVTGVDPDRYLKEPTPGAGKVRITANEAISVIFDGMMPDGVPAEPSAEDHLKQLQAFMDDDKFGLLDHAKLEMFRIWLTQIAQLAVQEQGQQEIAQLADGFQKKQAVGAGEAPQPVDQDAPPVNKNELVDETLPGAGGGAAG
jgi:hypothetical protein